MTPKPMDLRTLRREITRLLEPRPEILEAYLFGSTARGERHTQSDIDIAVYVDARQCPDPPFGYRAALTTDLMAGLRTNRVDVVTLNTAPPLLYHRILRDGVRLLARDLRATTTREGRALSRYCDFLPQLARIEAAIRPRSPRPRPAR